MKARLRQAGFTIVELAMSLFAIGSLVGVGALIYVAIHFLAKIW